MKWLAAIIVVSAIALAGVFYVRDNMRRQQEHDRSVALTSALSEIRAAIRKFHSENGRYPSTLEELVPNYVRRVPADPITNAANWRTTTEETVTPSDDFSTAPAPKAQSVIIDVHSSAPGTDANGRAYSDY